MAPSHAHHLRLGIRRSCSARSFSFAHNDCADLEKTAIRPQETAAPSLFVVTESVFSMDGDQAPLDAIVSLCQRYGAHLIVDEAHATGVIGPAGAGLVQEHNCQKECFARIHTFGKAVGCHGAIVLGSARLRDYLINFSRAFIYTTALPPASVRAIAHCLCQIVPSHERPAQPAAAADPALSGQTSYLAYERLNSTTPIQVSSRSRQRGCPASG